MKTTTTIAEGMNPDEKLYYLLSGGEDNRRVIKICISEAEAGVYQGMLEAYRDLHKSYYSEDIRAAVLSRADRVGFKEEDIKCR